MNKVCRLSFLLLTCLSLAYSPDVVAGNGQIMFVAKLNTDNEVPVVRGDALGLVTFLLSEDRKEILIHGVFSNLTGAVTACRIYQGKKDENGTVLLDLTSQVTGSRLKAAFPLPPGLLNLAETGVLYINVHTTVHTSGEIRGQLSKMAEIIVPVYANEINQVPPGNGQAIGLGSLRFSQNLTRMQYQCLPVGLSGPAIAAHIHQGVSGVNGVVISPLNTGNLIAGTLEDSVLVRNIFQEIIMGNAYLNVHTALKPDGEIRAQLNLDATLNNGSCILNGDQEIPVVTTAALGYGYAAISPGLDSIRYTVIYTGLVPISAHIHQAVAGVAGPVMLALTNTAPGIYTGSSIIGVDQLTSFFKDELYFNIHTTANPAGEIRGQIENNLLNSFAFDLCGDQEVPKKTVNAYGAAYVAINKAATEMDYGIIVNALNGDATTVRMYDANFGSNGTTLSNLALPNPFTSQVTLVTGTLANRVNSDRAYINIHTAANPSGEIRGQVRRSLSCAVNTGNEEFEKTKLSLFKIPNRNIIQMESTFQNSLPVKFEMTDVHGHTVQECQSVLPAGQSRSEFELNFPNPGLYIFKVSNENKILGSFKICHL